MALELLMWDLGFSQGSSAWGNIELAELALPAKPSQLLCPSAYDSGKGMLSEDARHLSPPPLNVLYISSLNMALKNDACIFSLVSLWGQDLRHRKLAFIGSQTLQVSVLYLLWFAAVGIAPGLRPWALFDSLSFELVSKVKWLRERGKNSVIC